METTALSRTGVVVVEIECHWQHCKGLFVTNLHSCLHPQINCAVQTSGIFDTDILCTEDVHHKVHCVCLHGGTRNGCSIEQIDGSVQLLVPKPSVRVAVYVGISIVQIISLRAK